MGISVGSGEGVISGVGDGSGVGVASGVGVGSGRRGRTDGVDRERRASRERFFPGIVGEQAFDLPAVERGGNVEKRERVGIRALHAKTRKILRRRGGVVERRSVRAYDAPREEGRAVRAGNENGAFPFVHRFR